jgi:hypothetical protein
MMLSVILSNAVMLSVIFSNAVMLSGIMSSYFMSRRRDFSITIADVDDSGSVDVTRIYYLLRDHRFFDEKH